MWGGGSGWRARDSSRRGGGGGGWDHAAWHLGDMGMDFPPLGNSPKRATPLRRLRSPAQVQSLCCSLSGFCTGRYSKWSWSGVSSFLLQVSLFPQFKRIIPALRHLRRAGVAL